MEEITGRSEIIGFVDFGKHVKKLVFLSFRNVIPVLRITVAPPLSAGFIIISLL